MASPITLGAILKTIQEDGTLDPDKALVRKSAALKLIEHKKDFHGNTLDWSVPYAGLAGRSHTATSAEANDQNGRYARFSISTVSDFNKRKMNGVLVRKALKAGPSEEFIDYAKGEMGLAIASLSQNIARGFYGSRTGRRGVRGSVSSADLTLATIDDAVNFNIGDKIVAAATDGGTLRDSGDFVTLIAVNTETGVLTADANWSNIASMADGDSLYVEGDINLSWSGWDTYNPATAPTGGDSVFGSGVDRSLNPEVLAGLRITTTGTNIETVFIKAMAQCRKKPGDYYNDGAKILVSEEDFANIRIAKEGSRFVDSANPYNMEIEGFWVGTCKVIPDVFCPQGTFRILGDANFALRTISGVQIDTVDGNDLRKEAGDTYALMSVVDGNFSVQFPAALARGTIPST